MIKTVMSKLFGDWNERYLKKINPIILKTNSFEAQFEKLTDDELFNMTNVFRDRLANGESTDDILEEAFAVVRETTKRVLKMRHYDVQLIGGYVLHSGKIAEMKTGEGKTLAATLPLYLNALTGKGAHLVTVNDYLAKRDAAWMSPIYLKLGLTVGVIQHDVSKQVVWDDESQLTVKTLDVSRKEAYACDITYGTNNEFGFDYLRDNMKYEDAEFVQRKLHFAIVDEVDSILVDEARTPLIISGPTDESSEKYYIINNVVKHFKKDIHYTLDEKHRSSTLTDEGINKAEKELNINNLFDVANVDTLHFVNNALKAHAVFKLDVDYMINNGQVVIVDEHTGRAMPGRRYSDGLHQALEAKESVKIENENQTLASITFQNYFRMYEKLAGMTGTAATEAEEFKQIYNLEVISIPTHMPLARMDKPDLIYRTFEEKMEAIINEIERLRKKGQPVLVGTISIEKSELISKFLNKRKIPHDVLNAKNHEREALVIANAGQKGAVTIATNMAGRGTDIKLGEGIQELGGLYILGTERHESRRIDNQLRGRSGRQGDPGESRFFLSLDDDLLRVFGAEKISFLMNKLGMDDGEPIEHNLVSKAIENAQKKVESMHFEIRKHLLEYDNVANQQRNVIYGLRRTILDGKDIPAIMREFTETVSDTFWAEFINGAQDDEAFANAVEKIYGAKPDIKGIPSNNTNAYKEAVLAVFSEKIKDREIELGEHFIGLSRYILINVIDSRWKEHLLQMDYLRDSVGLRGYGQKDPLIEYKRESFSIFTDMYTRIQLEAMDLIMRVQIRQEAPIELKRKEQKHIKEERKDLFTSGGSEEKSKAEPVRRNQPKVGANDPCPCGSGKKYKNCHGSK